MDTIEETTSLVYLAYLLFHAYHLNKHWKQKIGMPFQALKNQDVLSRAEEFD